MSPSIHVMEDSNEGGENSDEDSREAKLDEGGRIAKVRLAARRRAFKKKGG